MKIKKLFTCDIEGILIFIFNFIVLITGIIFLVVLIGNLIIYGTFPILNYYSLQAFWLGLFLTSYLIFSFCVIIVAIIQTEKIVDRLGWKYDDD